MTWRDLLMLWKWRIEQFQSILAPAFYVTSLTLLVYPYVAWRLDGLHYGMALTWLGILLIVLAGARVWDACGLWREGQRTGVRRNQFAQGALMPKEVLFMHRVWLPLMTAVGADRAEVEAWIEEASEE